jgi:hypothetical protein
LDDLAVAPHRLRQQPERDAVVRDHRLGHRRDRLRERVHELVRADADLAVVGPEHGGDRVGVLELVALAPAGVGEADRERGQAALALLGEQRDDQARVEPARQQHPDRDVGDHPAPHRDAQRLEQRVLPVLRRPVRVRPLERRVPVGALRAGAVALDGQDRRRRELADAGEDRPRRRHDGVPAQVVVQRDRVDARVDAAGRDERRERRRRAQAAAGQLGKVERLDPQPVADEHRAAAAVVVQAEGEHPGEPVEHPLAPDAPALEQHLGVGVGGEHLPGALELGPQLTMVVDAAVEDDMELVVVHRLGAGRGEVDDRQPAMGERDAVAAPQPVAVRPARRERRVHPREGVAVRRAARAQLGAESAHGSDDRHVGARLARGHERAEEPGVTVERLGVPLDAEHEPLAGPLDRLDRPARRPRHRVQSGADAVDRLVVERVDLLLHRAADAGQSRVRRDLDGVRRHPTRVGLAVAGKMLVEAAAARDVERLGAAADAEDRQPGSVRAARDLELERVEAGLGRPEVRVGGGPVGGRVEVRPAGQADARERCDERGDQAGVDWGKHHRHGAGALERAHVRHAERELVLRRFALGERVGALRAPDLGCRHADQRRAARRSCHQCVALSVLQGNRGRDRVADRPAAPARGGSAGNEARCPYGVQR